MKMKMLRCEVLEYIEEKDMNITQFAKVCDVSQSAMRGYMQYYEVEAAQNSKSARQNRRRVMGVIYGLFKRTREKQGFCPLSDDEMRGIIMEMYWIPVIEKLPKSTVKTELYKGNFQSNSNRL